MIEYFCCYHSYENKISNLSDGEVGRLFRGLLHYSRTGEKPTLHGREAVAFDFMAYDVESGHTAYRLKCEQNRRNASTHRVDAPPPSLTDPVPPPATTVSLSHSAPTSAPTPENGDKADKVREKETADDGFEAFWQAYPKKVNKAATHRAWTSLRPDKTLRTTIADALESHKRSLQWRAKNGIYIPNPANWLIGERWLDTLPPDPKQLTNPTQSSLDLSGLDEELLRYTPRFVPRPPPDTAATTQKEKTEGSI